MEDNFDKGGPGKGTEVFVTNNTQSTGRFGDFLTHT